MLAGEMKTSRQYVRLRLGHEYSGGWLVSSPRNLPGVEYELHAACLARSPLEALNKLSKAGFLPCSQPPKMPRMSDADWELMLYKDHPVPLTVTPSQLRTLSRDPNGTGFRVPSASSVRLILSLTVLLNCGCALMQLWICRSGSLHELRGQLLSVWSGDSEDEEQFVPAQWIGAPSAYADVSEPGSDQSETVSAASQCSETASEEEQP
eukprot:s430_g5.t1